jgi:hypothetical protein
MASKDSLTSPAKLVAACRQQGLDRVVITDHNRLDGARAAQQIDPDRVIVGEEIMTQEGELLAAYVTEEVPRGLPPTEAIARLRAQGAFISVSHPFDQVRNGAWKLEALEAIIPLVDAIETFNARCVFADDNRQAQAFAQAHRLLGTCGSDAHTTWELGRARMILPEFSDAASLKTALQQARQQNRRSPWWIHLASTYAKWYKKAHPAIKP